jgi:hypothetical protein
MREKRQLKLSCEKSLEDFCVSCTMDHTVHEAKAKIDEKTRPPRCDDVLLCVPNKAVSKLFPGHASRLEPRWDVVSEIRCMHDMRKRGNQGCWMALLSTSSQAAIPSLRGFPPLGYLSRNGRVTERREDVVAVLTTHVA